MSKWTPDTIEEKYDELKSAIFDAMKESDPASYLKIELLISILKIIFRS